MGKRLQEQMPPPANLNEVRQRVVQICKNKETPVIKFFFSVLNFIIFVEDWKIVKSISNKIVQAVRDLYLWIVKGVQMCFEKYVMVPELNFLNFKMIR
jgi:hypothetical protein